MKWTLIALPFLAVLAPAVGSAQLVQSAAALARSADSFELVPGAVVNPAAGQLFLMKPGGAIEALSLADGNSIWRTESAAKPLALYGSLLMAQVEGGDAVEIAFLDADRGDSTASMSVPLAAGFRNRVDDALGRRVTVSAATEQGLPEVKLDLHERYTKGVAPPQGEALERRQLVRYRLDIQTSEVNQLPDTIRSAARVDLPASVTSWMADRPDAQVLEADRIVALTEVGNNRRRITLKRWSRDGGGALPDAVVHEGEYILQFPSVDRRHLLIAERVAPGQFEEYEWSIFEVATGQRLGQLRHHQSHAPFFVSEGAVIFEARPYGVRAEGEWREFPRQIKSQQLGSGALVWETELRDTRFRGLLPP